MPENGTFFWNELVTSNQKKSGDFLSQLLGWNRKEEDMGPLGIYTIFQQNGQDVAGMMNPATDYSRSRDAFWAGYIAVEDVDACVARAVELGGEIIAPPEDIPGVGRTCMLADPMGAAVCLMTLPKEV